MIDPCFFLLSFWYPPTASLASYLRLAGCGFNLAPLMMETPVQGRKILDLAQQVGLKVLALDNRLYPGLALKPNWRDLVQQVVADYGDHPALWGYFVADEPSAQQYPHLAEICRAFELADPIHVPFINLYPNFASTEQLGTLDYRNHVRSYLKVVKPPFLCFDHFCLLERGDRAGYFSNLEIIREEALRARVRLIQFVLSTPHYTYRAPAAEDMRWQVYTSLAYGATGLGFFTYQPRDVENYGDGIVTLFGHPTERYGVMQQLNEEVSHLAPWLLRLHSVGVYHVPVIDESNGVPGEGSVVIAAEGGQLLLGEFVDDQDKQWLLVVNKDRTSSARVTLRLHSHERVLNEVARSTGQLRPLAIDPLATDHSIPYQDGLVVKFWLAPADGRLLRLGPDAHGNKGRRHR
jgi:hypothetical protein